MQRIDSFELRVGGTNRHVQPPSNRVSPPDRCRTRPTGNRAADSPFRSREDTDLPRLVAERRAVIHRDAGLRLPLMHHLVQQRVLHLGPAMAGDVATTDGDLDRPPGPDLHAQLAEPRPHPAGEPERQAPQRSAEVLAVEPLVGLAQAVE